MANNSISTAKIQDNAITAEKMGTNYVAGFAVNGIPVSSIGAVINVTGGDNTSLQFNEETNTLTINSASSADGKGNGGGNKTMGASPIQTISANSPLSASTDINGNATIGILAGASDGDLLIWNAGSSAWVDEAVSGDVTINGAAPHTSTIFKAFLFPRLPPRPGI